MRTADDHIVPGHEEDLSFPDEVKEFLQPDEVRDEEKAERPPLKVRVKRIKTKLEQLEEKHKKFERRKEIRKNV